MNYRREIDGLRAVAVLPVILFHAGFTVFSGGYVGVDVFFVISGYLITSILLADIRAGKFTITRFYERRARRILPALTVVLIACLPFAWLWMIPGELKDFAKTLVGTATFVSNIVLLRQSGYFDGEADLKPLLHTWSLAVEEQYYVLFPLFLAFAWRLFRNRTSALIAALLVLSLLLAQWGSAHLPLPTYYLLPTRGWELLIGSLIAVVPNSAIPPSFKASRTGILTGETLALAGMALIAWSVFAYDKFTPFPGFYALAPTVGTALVIYFADHQTLTGRVLGARALVGLGLISYSAYLWHQPILALAMYRSQDPLNLATVAALVALAIVLAYFTWKYVETPFRDRQRVSRRTIFVGAVAAGASLVAVGVVGIVSDGLPQRALHDGLTFGTLQDKLRPNYGLSKQCDGAFPPAPACRTSQTPQILVWGDSFAMHLVPGLLAENPNARLVQLTSSSCGPIFNLAVVSPGRGTQAAKDCVDFTNNVDRWLSQNPSVRYVVMSSPFLQYFYNTNRLMDGTRIVPVDPQLVVDRLRATLKSIAARGAVPVIISPTPSNGVNTGRCLAKHLAFGRPLERCNFPERDLTPDRALVFAFLREIQSDYKVVWLDEAICPGGTCQVFRGSTFLYRDGDHLSVEGSAFLGRNYGFLRNAAAGPLASGAASQAAN